MKKMLTIAFFAIGMLQVQAQSNRTCASHIYMQEQFAQNPNMRLMHEQNERITQEYIANHAGEKSSAVVTIPVVFHILYNTASQNISDNRIMDQLQALNDDFARTNADAVNTPAIFASISSNTQIQFCLAKRSPTGAATTGINRVSTTVTSFPYNSSMKYTSSGGANAWNRDKYLNIWVCNLGSGLLGFATFPGGTAAEDGVVCLYSAVGGPNYPGTYNPYHLGRTLTHEVGHWLNLYHIWGDSYCGNDQVTDTPTQQTANYGCPNFPHVTCSNGPNGDMFMNYMDYTDDGCMNAFSNGQGARMNACLNTTRVSLKTSDGCTPLGCVDIYEPNGTTATAKQIAVNTNIYGLINPTNDVDMYKFNTTTAKPKIKVTLQQLPANYSLRLMSPTNATLANSLNAGLTNETIIYNATTAGTGYKVRVWGVSGAYHATNCYRLRVSTSATNWVRLIDELAYDAEGLNAYPNPAQEDIALAFNSEQEGNATITIYDAMGQLVLVQNEAVVEGANLVNLKLNNLNSGLYFVEMNNSNSISRIKIIKE